MRSATFEFYAPGAINGAKGLVGSAFALGPNRFVTTAHLLDTAVGSRFGHPVLIDSRRVEYPLAEILQYSESRDYVIFSLKPAASHAAGCPRVEQPGEKQLRMRIVAVEYLAGTRGTLHPRLLDRLRAVGLADQADDAAGIAIDRTADPVPRVCFYAS